MSAQGTALAGGAIAAALFEVLAENKMLTKDQATAVIDRAWGKLAPFDGIDKLEAQKVLGSVGQFMASRYTEANYE